VVTADMRENRHRGYQQSKKAHVQAPMQLPTAADAGMASCGSASSPR
jgi:hypothetical protein